MPFADIRGSRLFFTDEGERDGIPMFFVHGFTCDSHDWSWQLPHFGRTHRVIAFDLRGHGSSSAPDDGYDLASLTADSIELLERLAGVPAIVVGHSLGGIIATMMAVERPDLVRSVVAIDPGYLFPDERAPYLANALAEYLGEDPASVPARIFDAGAHNEATPPAFATWHNRRAMGVPVHVLRQTVVGLLGGTPPFPLRSVSGPYFAPLKRPVLTLFADKGRCEIAGDVFDTPLSMSTRVPTVGHWLHQERPDEVNAIIEDWLHELAPSGDEMKNGSL